MKAFRSLSIPLNFLPVGGSSSVTRNLTSRKSIIVRRKRENEVLVSRLLDENRKIRGKLKEMNEKLNEVFSNNGIRDFKEKKTGDRLGEVFREVKYYKSEYQRLKKRTGILREKKYENELVKEIEDKRKCLDELSISIKKLKKRLENFVIIQEKNEDKDGITTYKDFKFFSGKIKEMEQNTQKFKENFENLEKKRETLQKKFQNLSQINNTEKAEKGDLHLDMKKKLKQLEVLKNEFSSKLKSYNLKIKVLSAELESKKLTEKDLSEHLETLYQNLEKRKKFSSDISVLSSPKTARFYLTEDFI